MDEEEFKVPENGRAKKKKRVKLPPKEQEKGMAFKNAYQSVDGLEECNTYTTDTDNTGMKLQPTQEHNETELEGYYTQFLGKNFKVRAKTMEAYNEIISMLEMNKVLFLTHTRIAILKKPRTWFSRNHSTWKMKLQSSKNLKQRTLS